MQDLNWKKKVIIYPTDTVWGIGGNIFEFDIYQKIQKIKNSAPNKPVSILFSGLDQLKNYFDIKNIGYFQKTPDIDAFLNKFFILETTLLIPKKLNIKNEIPKWIYAEESNVGVRVLPKRTIEYIIQKVKSPIITTSLNVTGDPPITQIEMARSFYDKYAPNEIFVTPKTIEDQTMSSASSTIVILEENTGPRILRAGQKVEEVKKLIKTILD